MTKKRLFVAINLPDHVRKTLEKEAAGLALKLPETVRFTPPEFLHFTLTFLGYQTDEDVGEIIAAMREIIPQCTPPEIKIERMTYGPIGASARMVWAVTDKEASLAMGVIKEALEDAFAARGVRFEREARKYIGHLTLARFGHIKDLPDAEAMLALSFVPETVDLMESRLTRSGAEYALLAGVEFGE